MTSWQFNLSYLVSICLTLMEVAIQFLSELQSRAQQSRFHCWDGNTQRGSGIFGGKFFNIAQHKNGSIVWLKLVDHTGKNFAHFRLRKALFRAWAPVLQFARHQVFVAL